jgi:MraZ protein
LVLTTGLDQCVVAYPMRAWTAFEEKLMALSQFDEAVTDLRRIYIHNAADCEVDSVGRILIPPSLREHADLKREAVWAGSGNPVELWAKEHHAALRKDIMSDEDRRKKMQRRLTELGM